ncbi:MAG: hypothetical protein WAV15_01380 [Minisyncoccia bacterium]
MNKKSFGVIIGVFAVGLILVGGYLAWAKKEKAEPIVPETLQVDVSNWKTYVNTEYGFEFKYPTDLVIDEVKGSSNFEKRFTNVTVDTPSNIEEAKQINEGPGSEGLPYLLSIAGHEPSYEVLNECEGVASKVMLGGVQANKCVDDAIDGPRLYIRLTKDGVVYYGLGSLVYSGNNINIVDQIISTFKLTK